MAKKRSRALASGTQRCLHHDQEWNAQPELTHWVAPLEARFCIVCVDWLRERDRQKFLRFVRGALAEGKTKEEIARALELDGIADPFSEPPSTYLTALLTKSKYAITEGILERFP